MARHLADADFEVKGFDIDPDAITRLADSGVAICDTAHEAATGVELLFVVVFRDTEADRILFGDDEKDGVLELLADGATVVMNTTVSPDTARDYEKRLAAMGYGYVDAPVTGGKAGADAGTLTVIASGNERSMTATKDAFDAMGGRTYNCGDAAGDASTVHVAAMCEALAFATKAGADPEMVYDVITHGTGNSEIFKSRAPHIFEEDYAPRGVTEIFTKDLGVVTEVARSIEFPLPMTSLALQQFVATASSGYARHDGIALAKIYENLGGVDIAKAHGKSKRK